MKEIKQIKKQLEFLNSYPVPNIGTKPFRKRNCFYLLKDTNTRYRLNRTAAQIIELCDGSHTLSQVAKIMAHNYNTFQVEKDVISFCLSMINEDLITLNNTPVDLRWQFWQEELPLLSATIEITQNCNMNCHHCYNSSGSNSFNNLSFEEIDNLLKDLVSLGTCTVNFSGGEPLLHSELECLVQRASNLGLQVGIATNGLLLNFERLDRLKKAGLKTVQISIDFIGKEHDLFRGVPGAFERAKAALCTVVKEGLCVLLSTTIMRQTPYDFKELHFLAADCGVTYHLLNRFIPVGRGSKMNNDQVNDTFNNAIKVLLDKPVIPIISCDPTITKAFHCPAGYSSCAIAVNGDVKPCVNFFAPAGNIRSENIRSIWRHSRIFEIIREKAFIANLHGESENCLSYKFSQQRDIFFSNEKIKYNHS